MPPVVFILYALTTVATICVSMLNSMKERKGPTAYQPEDFTAVEVALLASGEARAIDVAVVEALRLGTVRIERVEGSARGHVIVAGPMRTALDNDRIPVMAFDQPLRRGEVMRLLQPEMSSRSEELVRRGLLRSRRDMTATIMGRSYPLALSTGLGLFILALHPGGSWSETATGVCFGIGLAALLLVNTQIRLTGLGRRTLVAIRRLHGKNHGESFVRLPYDVALWGVERLESTPYADYLNEATIPES